LASSFGASCPVQFAGMASCAWEDGLKIKRPSTQISVSPGNQNAMYTGILCGVSAHTFLHTDLSAEIATADNARPHDAAID